MNICLSYLIFVHIWSFIDRKILKLKSWNILTNPTCTFFKRLINPTNEKRKKNCTILRKEVNEPTFHSLLINLLIFFAINFTTISQLRAGKPPPTSPCYTMIPSKPADHRSSHKFINSDHHKCPDNAYPI